MSRRRVIAYGAALALANLTVIGGFVLVRHTESELRERTYQRLEEHRAAGDPLPVLPRGDLDGFDLSREVSVRTPTGLTLRVDLSLWMMAYWQLLIPATVAGCLGIAWVLDTLWLSRTGPTESGSWGGASAVPGTAPPSGCSPRASPR